MAWKLDHFLHRRSSYRFAPDIFTPTSGVMKLALVLLAVFGTATCSLEPAGYLPPTRSHYTTAPHRAFSDSRGAPPSTSYGRPDYQTPLQEQYESSRYDFGYQVRDNRGNDYGHQEAREGTSVRGSYYVVLPDGRKQIVEYVADEEGFKPRIFYEKSDARRTASLDGHSAYPGAPY